MDGPAVPVVSPFSRRTLTRAQRRARSRRVEWALGLAGVAVSVTNWGSAPYQAARAHGFAGEPGQHHEHLRRLHPSQRHVELRRDRPDQDHVELALPNVPRHPAHVRLHGGDHQAGDAGDGTHEHPTQGLLDIFTMRQHKGRIEGLTVASIILGTLLGGVLVSQAVSSTLLAFDFPGIETGIDSVSEAAIGFLVDRLGAQTGSEIEPPVIGLPGTNTQSAPASLEGDRLGAPELLAQALGREYASLRGDPG